jgi:hypothetical protein
MGNYCIPVPIVKKNRLNQLSALFLTLGAFLARRSAIGTINANQRSAVGKRGSLE